MIEDPAEERVHESPGDAISQPAGQNSAALVLEIFALLQIAVADQKLRRPLLHRHPAPDLRHEQADVVIHADIAARRNPPP